MFLSDIQFNSKILNIVLIGSFYIIYISYMSNLKINSINAELFIYDYLWILSNCSISLYLKLSFLPE